MAYRLKASESIPENIRRVVLEEIESATQTLDGGRKKGRDEAVHEARKSIKKIRGVLRLVRPELGKIYREENRRFRAVGWQLSQLRDSAALLEIFDQVIGKHGEALEKKSFLSLRRGLRRDKRETEERLGMVKVIDTTLGALRSASQRVKHWPLNRDGFSALAPGLRQTYRSGRNALAEVQKRPSDVAYHTFRRRVKDHWYHVRLLESLWTEVMQAHEASLKELETWLGDDHNLVVLRDKMKDHPENYGPENEIQVFLSLADQQQKELREKSLSLGQRVYTQKPRMVSGNLADLWDAWHDQPDSMKETQKAQREADRKPASKASGKKAKKAAA